MSRALVLLAIWACAESFTPPIRTATRRRLVVGAGPADEDDDFDFEAAYRAKVAADGGALGNRAKQTVARLQREGDAVAQLLQTSPPRKRPSFLARRLWSRWTAAMATARSPRRTTLASRAARAPAAAA